MPELPEVETVARQLEPCLVRKKLKAFVIHDSKLKSPKKNLLLNKTVKKVFRVGKEIVIEFSSGLFISIHLRMSGRLIWVPTKESENHSKWVRARFKFRGGELRFIDPRRFGTFKFAQSLDELRPKGVDPIRDKFSSSGLVNMLDGSKQQIKTFLLRQDRIVGLGNIYASEILFDSKIDPRRLCCEVTKDEASLLVKSTRKILKKAIKNCGTTFSDFQGANGELGSYQNYLEVYGREGEDCKCCGESILRIVQQQRSTFYCSSCQK